jgi:NADH:ubiquinone oxidoreductase subunit K
VAAVEAVFILALHGMIFRNREEASIALQRMPKLDIIAKGG